MAEMVEENYITMGHVMEKKYAPNWKQHEFIRMSRIIKRSTIWNLA